jgi:zinc transport system substrate-binding protein
VFVFSKNFIERHMMKKKQISAKILVLIAVLFLSSAIAGVAGEKIAVTTTMMPLAFFIEEIGGEYVDVNVMIAESGNPHAYEPTPGQMRALSQADIYVKVGSGVEFELTWMDKLLALNPEMKVCDASKGIPLILMEDHHDGHGDHDEHHGEYDPHIWLSLNNAVIMAENIRDALIDFSPEKKDVFVKNTAGLILRLDELKRYASQTFEKISTRTFLIFHPAWGYFARDFHLTQIAAQQGGKEPTPRRLNALIRQAQQLGVKVIFASPQFSQKSARVIAAEIKGRVLLIDPLSKDYMENMRQVIEAFEMSMR